MGGTVGLLFRASARVHRGPPVRMCPRRSPRRRWPAMHWRSSRAQLCFNRGTARFRWLAAPVHPRGIVSGV